MLFRWFCLRWHDQVLRVSTDNMVGPLIKVMNPIVLSNSGVFKDATAEEVPKAAKKERDNFRKVVGSEVAS